MTANPSGIPFYRRSEKGNRVNSFIENVMSSKDKNLPEWLNQLRKDLPELEPAYLDVLTEFLDISSESAPWTEKKEKILSLLNKWRNNCRSKLGFDSPLAPIDETSPLSRGVFYCLAYRAYEAGKVRPFAVSAILDDLENKKPVFKENKPDKTNPLLGLSLGDALIEEVKSKSSLLPAKKYLEENFGGLAVKAVKFINDNYPPGYLRAKTHVDAFKISSNLDDCEWWSDLYLILVGLYAGHKPPLLRDYRGESGIGKWFGDIFYPTLRDLYKLYKLSKLPKDPHSFGSPAPSNQENDEDNEAHLPAPILTPDRKAELNEFKVELEKFEAELEKFWLQLSKPRQSVILSWSEKFKKRWEKLVEASSNTPSS